MSRRARPTQPGPEGVDPRIIKAMAHPLRYRVLVRLNEGEASPVEIARELGEPVGRVSHHVRMLARLGAIELTRTEPRRGAVEHFYRASVYAWFTDEQWAQVPRSAQRAITGQNLEHVVRDVSGAADHGFEHPKAHVSVKRLNLDEQGMGEMSALLTETLTRALEVEAASARRSGDDRFATEVILLHFERRE